MPINWMSKEEWDEAILKLPRISEDDGSLIEACRKGNKDEVKRLLAVGANIDALGFTKSDIDYMNKSREMWFGYPSGTPLTEAITGEHPDIAEFLLEQGAMPDKQTPARSNAHFSRPLSIAILYGYTELVEKILNKGVDLNSRGKTDEMLPIEFAVDYSRLDIFAMLLQRGANDAKKYLKEREEWISEARTTRNKKDDYVAYVAIFVQNANKIYNIWNGNGSDEEKNAAIEKICDAWKKREARKAEERKQQKNGKTEIGRQIEKVRRRMQTNTISGTVVADKIVDDMKKGKVITPKIGKELAAKYKKEYALKRQNVKE